SDTAGEHHLPGVLAVTTPALFWLLLNQLPSADFYWAYCTAFAIAAAHIQLAASHQKGHPARLMPYSRPSLAGALLVALVALLIPIDPANWRSLMPPIIALFTIYTAVLALDRLEFRSHGQRNTEARWLRQGAVGLAGSLPVALVTLIIS
ncbi:MAG: hypothetical protein ACOCVG_05505, partial [Verrucomicrobiota bacterium]